MKFNQYTWDLYKDSPHGISNIKTFETIVEDMRDYELLAKYNPLFAKFVTKEKFEELLEIIYAYGISDYSDPENIEEAKDIYKSLIFHGIPVEREYVICPQDYETMLQVNTHISLIAYIFCPEFFFPNFFVYRFFDLKKIADAFEVDLPKLPKKSDYKARCMYYWELCEVFYNFRIENGLSPAEFCSFLYDFAINFIPKDISFIPKPSQAWFIGGKIDSTDLTANTPFWQGNVDTNKGDILVHYETSPISAITKIWIAQTDGIIDPFFHYYSNVYIGDVIDIPHITLKDLKVDEYFSKHSLVRKSFQGVNGWSISNEDYNQLIRLLKRKNFDIETLPKLYSPILPKNVSINCERDVERELLEYYLNKIGLQETKDYIRQLPTRAGRGSKVYPDYALHFNNKTGDESAKILIEVKYHMKNNKDIEEAFQQARSYAKLLEASMIVLCDKVCLLIYEKRESFDRDRYAKYFWEDFENPDTFRILQNKFIAKGVNK